MPRLPQNSKKCPRSRAKHALLLGGVALAVAWPAQAVFAQDIGELRGSLATDGIEFSDPPTQKAPPQKPNLPEAVEAKQAEQPSEKELQDRAEAGGYDDDAGTDSMPTGTVPPSPPSAFPPSIIPAQTIALADDDFTDDFPVDEEPGPSQPSVPPQPIADTNVQQAAANRQRAVDTVTSAADEVPAANLPVSPVGPVADQPIDAEAKREPSIEALNRSVVANPYEAVGVRWGGFILKPSLDTGVTATSNADSSVDGSSAVLSETTLRLNAVSDWSSHRATVDAFGTFRKTLSGQEVEDVEGAVAAELLLDLGNDYRARGTFSYAAAPESAASPVVIADAVEEPITQRFGGTLGLEKDAGKARFAITGGISHDSYGDADLEGGGVLSQADRDATLYTLALRTGYEISPALIPFVETEIGRNAYNEEVDSAGYRRSSDRWAVRAGLAFDRGEKFSGEIAAGVMREEFDDERLNPLSAPSLRGAVLWSPLRGTNVRLTGATILEGTTTPGESGSVLYSSALSIERQMRANLTGNLTFGAAWRDYSGPDGEETILNAEASLTWWFNRYAGLTGRLRHETVSSTLPDRDTDTNSIFLGLRLQR
jgi:hypothetical protein